ncbi:MAG TPA: hypothetical protein VFT53_00865 [Candidatus Saccharimonadales bacterium]|nr:hypothetical protein [Candidatus Saccharimonadales bacterium]
MKRKLFGVGFTIFIASIIGFQGGASALTANYNNVIDDAVFDNANAMDANQIDTFLNSFPNSCISSNSGFTSPDPTGYNPSQGFLFGGNVSAGTVIHDAAQAYGINPQVILATLQKEQSLVTGSAGCYPNNPNPSWPQADAPASGKTFTCTVNGHSTTCTYACPYSGGCINIALGYNCPGYCKAADENFSKQIIGAAWSFTFNRHRAEGLNNWYINKPNWDNSDDLGFCYSGYDVAGGPYYLCPDQASHANDPYVSHSGQYVIDGSTVVTMTNGATAALFDYTPHLHGQDLFVTNFTNWFGPTTSATSGITMTNNTQPDPTPARGETVQYVFTLTNTYPFSVTLDAVGVVGRLGSPTSATNRDFGWQGPVTLAANASQQFTFTSLVQDTGALYAWPAVMREGIYTHYNNWGAQMNAHNPNITITSALSSTLTNPIASQTGTLSATIKNNESHAIQFGTLGIPVRYYSRYNYDTAWSASPVSIASGATQTISGSVTFDKPGPYTAWVAGLIGNQYLSLSDNINLSTAPAVPKFSLTYIETPDATPALGEDVVVKFSLKNDSGIPMTLNAVGVAGRYGSPTSSVNNDLGWVGPISFAAGEEKSFTTFTTNISDTRNFYAWVVINYQGTYIHYNSLGFTLYPHIPSVTFVSPLSVNGGSKPTIGQSVPVSVTIRNNEPRAIRYNAIGIPIRYYGVYNYDATWQGPGSLAPAGQSGDTVSLSGTVTFDKPGPYTIWASINIPSGRYLTLGGTLNMTL